MSMNGNGAGNNVLEGLRVLDFTQLIAGPTCTRILADMGAEVIKVERPPTGDAARALPAVKNGVSGLFMQFNAGKKGFCLDLNKSESTEIIKKLVKHCDVVVENFRVGVMKRMGIDYDVLKEINPKLIMCSISGYGQEGPNRDLPSVAATIHAATGVTDIYSQNPDGSRTPGPHNLSLADTISGFHASNAITSALYYRERTGIGQYIDICLFDSLFFTIDYQVEYYLMTGQEPPPFWGSTPVKGKDGYLTVGLAKYDLLIRLLKCMGIENDDRFSSMEKMTENSAELRQIAADWVYGFDSVDEPEAILREAGIPANKILSVVDAANSEQVKDRKLLKEVEHPKIGKVRVMNSPFKFSETKSELRGLPPEIGEHNREVLSDILSYSDKEIEKFYKDEILFSGS